MTVITFIDAFEGGAPGDPITDADSIFAVVNIGDPVAQYYVSGRSGNSGGVDAFDVSVGGYSFLALDLSALPIWTFTTLRQYYDAQVLIGPDAGVGFTYEEYEALVIGIFGSAETFLDLTNGTPAAVYRHDRVECWFRWSDTRELHGDDSLLIVSETPILPWVTADWDGVSAWELKVGGSVVAPAVPGDWYHYEATYNGSDYDVTLRDAGGSLMGSTTQASYLDQTWLLSITVGVSEDYDRFPIEFDDFTYVVTVYEGPDAVITGRGDGVRRVFT